MPETKIIGYKKVFGFVMPDWVNEGMVKNFGIGLLAVATMFLILIFVVWPNLGLVKTREADLSASKAKLEALKTSKAGLDRMVTDLTGDDQVRILQAIPQSYSPEGAIYTLRRISADSGVSIVSYTLPSGDLLSSTTPISAGAGAVSGGEMVGFSEFPIKLVVSAPVADLLRFIAGVESSLPFGVVSDLNVQEVSKLSRTSADKSVQLSLEIKYFQSLLKTVNINKIVPLSEYDLKLSQELRKYNVLSIPLTQDIDLSGIASGSGSLFGF